MRQAFGCATCAAVRASCRKRLRRSLLEPGSRTTFRATTRSSRSSCALYTMPILPSPTCDSTRYGPILLGASNIVLLTPFRCKDTGPDSPALQPRAIAGIRDSLVAPKDIRCGTPYQRLLDVFLTRGYASDSGLVPQKFSASLDEQVLVADTPLQITGRDEDRTEPQISVIGAVVYALKGAVANVQDYAILCGRTFVSLITPPYYLQDILQQMDSIGAGSLPIILLSGFFIGAVMVLQTGSQFTRFGQSSLTGDVVAIALVRELGPSLTGLLVTGRCATGIASELGSMLV